MRNYKLENKLNEYILNPRKDRCNFELANSYFDIEQYASAISYYLRSAELSKNDDLVYESLLCSWDCMAKVGGRPVFERGQILQAISHSPHRPEAYNAMCLWLEFCGHRIPSSEEKYLTMYSYACIGISNILSNKDFEYYNRYDGYFAFLYYKAIAGWHIGKTQESKELFLELANNPNNNLNERYKTLIKETIENVGISHLVKE